MKRKLLYLIFMIMGFMIIGCIKETYDMNKLSKEVHLSPTMAVSAIKGDISLKDLDIWSDTVVSDQNNLVKIIFKKDSIFNLSIDDFFPTVKAQRSILAMMCCMSAEGEGSAGRALPPLRAARVRGLTTPSGRMPFCRWKAMTTSASCSS